MGERTNISWTDHTLNPWTRCTHATLLGAEDPLCANCYAETWSKRATHPKDATGRALPLWGSEAPRDETKRWEQNLRKWDEAAFRDGVRRRVFCASLADVFEEHPAITPERRERVLYALARCTNLDVQLLTKRPENVKRMVPATWLVTGAPADSRFGWPAHIWIGTSVGTQAGAEERIPHLLRVPARTRFLSVEPQLEAVDLRAWLGYAIRGTRDADHGVAWVIQGGESGSKARPFNRMWARSLRDQCRAADVAYFYKQEGSRMFDGAVEYRFTPRDARHDEAHFAADLRNCRAFPEAP